MNDQTEVRDRELGRAIARIPVPPSAAPLAFPVEPGRRRRVRVWLLAATLALAAIGGLFAAGVLGSHPANPPTTALDRLRAHNEAAWKRLASRAVPGSTGVRTLLAYTRLEHAVKADDLPASVAESIGQEERFAAGGNGPTSIQEPIAGDPATGDPSIYLIAYPDNLCMVIALEGAVGSCYAALRQADGSISLDDSIVDGKRFIHGLVANDVIAVTVSLPAAGKTPAATVQATIENNVFLAPLPYNGGYDVGAATVTVTRADGSTSAVQTGGISGPPPGP